MKTPMKFFAASLLALALTGCGGYDSAVAPHESSESPEVPLPLEILVPQPIDVPDVPAPSAP